MANHIRQQIRERAGTVLTGLTTTGSNVFQTRVYPLENTNLPALVIYTKDEKQTSNFDDEIDKICKEVEIAISADTTLNGLAKDCYLQSTSIEYNTEGEQPLSYAVLTFLTNYYVQETAPDVAV